MEYNGYDIKFLVDKYTEDDSTYIGAYIKEDKEYDLYADVTIYGYRTTFGGEEIALDINNEKKLIDAMVENGLIVITERIALRTDYCNYPIGRLTKKFFDEVIGDKAGAYEVVFANELKED